MADDQKAEQARKRTLKEFFISLFLDLIVFGFGKKVLETVTSVFTRQAVESKTEKHKKGDKHDFAAAMAQLDQAKAASIRLFMRTQLKNLDERSDFMVNAARIEPGVEGTKKFLEVFADIPDTEKKNYLKDISFIGKGEQSFLEQSAPHIEKFTRYLRTLTRHQELLNKTRRKDQFWDNYSRLRRLRSQRKPSLQQRAMSFLFGW